MSALQQRLWAPYSPILLAPLRQRRHTGELWIWLGLLALILLLALGLGVSKGWAAARLVLGIAALPSLLILWCISFSSLQQQNHPNAARLVPGHVARLRRCAVGLLLALTLLVTVLYGPVTDSPLLWALGTATTLVIFAICLRWWWLWFGIWILPSLGFLWPFNNLFALLWGGMKQWYVQQPASLAGLALLVLPWLLSRLLQEGGASHRGNYTRQAQMRKIFNNQQQSLMTPKYTGTLGMRCMRLFSWPQPLWHQYLLRHARPEARSALARAELVYLGNLHWTCFLGSISVVLTLVALGAIAAELYTAPNWASLASQGGLGLHIGIVSMAINPLLGLPANLYRSRREQSLLLLLPGTPRGPALNRHMARRFLLQFHLHWAFGMSLILLLISLGSAAQTASYVGLYALLATLPMGSLLLRDWSKQAMPNLAALALPFALAPLGASAAFGLHWLGLSLGWIAGLSVLLSALMLAWRWPRYVRNSASYMPVGRWA
ncbi:hypothetical protein [Paucibacter sp. Y2R2-4]|uniref:hypothetical protein n=1 Tax=Paucibacter sp. Y2R2-4 TaxID=2893553 RepID=UPI0021E4E9FD|nr:hypothetical protein [Paucibacter sp. Y2R2-4]MCV2351514.1 hypothetical protein [Paucibacter sp. Y2R2-4]